MKDFDKSYKEFALLKENLTSDFLRYIKDRKIPIIERLDMYEKYAEDLLPVGSWRSDVPKWIFTDLFDLTERYQIVTFYDIVENLYNEERKDMLFDEDGKLTFVSDEMTNKLNKLLDTGLSGTHNDW